MANSAYSASVAGDMPSARSKARSGTFIVITARLNAGASVTGTMTELNVIAATVIGGTSLAGGVGTVYGAIVGALIMQSLESGMILMGVATPLQRMVLALVLIAAVWVDMAYRRVRLL